MRWGSRGALYARRICPKEHGGVSFVLEAENWKQLNWQSLLPPSLSSGGVVKRDTGLASCPF